MLSQSKATHGKFAGGSSGIATKGYIIIGTSFIQRALQAIYGSIRTLIEAFSIYFISSTEAVYLPINAESSNVRKIETIEAFRFSTKAESIYRR